MTTVWIYVDGGWSSALMANLAGAIRRSPKSEIGSKLASGSSPPYPASELRQGPWGVWNG
jgi:hypothetical protein